MEWVMSMVLVVMAMSSKLFRWASRWMQATWHACAGPH